MIYTYNDIYNIYQQDVLGLDDHGPGSRVEDEGFDEAVLGNVDEGRLQAGSEHDLLRLF